MGKRRIKAEDWFTEKKVEELKKYSKSNIMEIHRLRPEYIFLTERSSVPSGYFLKEALKKAYPNSPLPKFFRINPRCLDAKTLSREAHISEEEARKIIDKGFEDYFKKRITTPNCRYMILDDWVSSSGYSSLSATAETIERGLRQIGVKSDELPSISLPDTLAYGSETQALLPTTKLFGVMSQNKLSEREQRYNKRKRIEYLREEKFTLAGGIAHKNLRPEAYGFIQELKQIGGEVGEELHAELQKKKKSLEQRVSGITAILGIVGSLFFLSLNTTGNAIGNISQSSGSWLGIGLFLVGIAGVLVYFRSKKR